MWQKKKEKVVQRLCTVQKFKKIKKYDDKKNEDEQKK